MMFTLYLIVTHARQLKSLISSKEQNDIIISGMLNLTPHHWIPDVERVVAKGRSAVSTVEE